VRTLKERCVHISARPQSDVAKTRNGERGTENGERGTGNGELGTGVWERVYTGNPPKKSTWRTKEKKTEQFAEM